MTSGLETERVNSQRKRQVREEINKEKVGKHMIKTSKQYIYIAQKSKIEARAHRSRAQYTSEPAQGVSIIYYCYRCQYTENTNGNFMSRNPLQSLQDTIMKLAYWTFIYSM